MIAGGDRRLRALPNRKPRNIPHYVYRCYDKSGRLLYVGCSNNPIERIANHRMLAWWAGDIHTTRLLVFPNREKALQVEKDLIRSERPKCNVKSRWYNWDPRSDWTAQDYLEFHNTCIQTANGIFGPDTRKMIAQVERELAERFGVTSLAGRWSA